jgi:hypothetical protein
MPVITNVNVHQSMGNHFLVLSSLSADAQTVGNDTGVIVMAPLHPQNGGPVTGPFGIGNIYTITGTHNGAPWNMAGFRYIGQTPAGNAQFTTQ